MARSKSTGNLHKRPIVLLAAFVCGEIITAVLLLRPARDLFPLPVVGSGSNATVGYAIYAGYPMYFDTIMFNLIIFLPVLFLVILKVMHNY